jgi:hypothetical protein
MPTRTRLSDASGNMTKPWLDFLQTQLANTTTAPQAYATLTPDGSGAVAIEIGNTENFVLTLDGSSMTIAAPTGTFTTGDEFMLWLIQDATGNRAAPLFTGGTGGFAADTQARISQVLAGIAGTATACDFIYNGTVFLMRAIPASGIQLS